MSHASLSRQLRWLWDPHSQQYYWYDEPTDTINYENGARAPRPPDFVIPRTSFPSSSHRAPAPSDHWEGNELNYPPSSQPLSHGQFTHPESPGSASGGPLSPRQPPSGSNRRSSISTDDLARGVKGVRIEDTPAQSVASPQKYMPTPLPPRTATFPNGTNFSLVEDKRSGVRTAFQPKPAFTDPALAQFGIRGYRYLVSPDENQTETLFKSYQKRSQPKRFFTVGKVFLVLWVEPKGESLITNFEPGETLGRFGEKVFSKVRRFIVIRQGDTYCTCLPIVSYGNRGVGKPGVKKSEHSIVYTGKAPPQQLPTEAPKRGEEGMRPLAVRIDVDDLSEKLEIASRLDYGKVYTIQHNIKVKSFGKVHPKSMNALVHQFGNVWNSQPVLGYIGIQDPQVDVSSVGSDNRPSGQRRESETARAGTGSHGQSEQSKSPHQPSDSRLETKEDSRPDTLQQYARAAVRRLMERGYSEADAMTIVRKQLRKAAGEDDSSDEAENDDDDDDDDEVDEDDEEDQEPRSGSGKAQSSSYGHSASSRVGRETTRSGQSQTGPSTVSPQTHHGKQPAGASIPSNTSTTPAIGEAGSSRYPEASNSQTRPRPQVAPSAAGSTASAQSQAIARAWMLEYRQQGYSQEDALRKVQKRMSRKDS